MNGTFDRDKVMADAEALHDLFNVFGRGRVSESQFIVMYLSGKLPEYIKKVVEDAGRNE